MDAAKTKHLISIQYLRGVAAMMVVFHHAMAAAPWLTATGVSIQAGARGVDIFFVISGFIMYSAARSQTVGEFVWRRCTRVIPLYWIATMAFLLYAVAVTKGRALSPETMAHVGQSLLFIPHWSLSDPSKAWPYLVPGWTLNYEMFFYGIFALGLATGRVVLLPTLTICALTMIGFVVAPTGAAAVTYTSPLMLEFLAGIWIAVLHERGLLRRVGWMLPVGFACLLLG
jgi:exopolysaccharide production protein ExoZ